MDLGLHSCGMWLHRRLIEARLFEPTKWSHLEGIFTEVSVVQYVKKNQFQWGYAKPKEEIWQIIALY
jgi:hypothetical protein